MPETKHPYFLGEDRALESYLYLPARAGRVAVGEFERRSSSPIRLTWGIPTLDNYLIPMMPGDLISVIGRPGHGKTSAMIHLTRACNQELVRVGEDKRLVVYATWETLVEEFVAVRTSAVSGYSLEDVGRGSIVLTDLQRAIGTTVDERIAVIGKSMNSPIGLHTLEDVETILTHLVEEGTPAAILMVDYLQRLPGAMGADRSSKVSEHHEKLKDIAISFRIPVIVGVQAKRDVDDYKGLQLPHMDDGQWTSVIEQTSDKVLGVSRPVKYMEPGSTVEISGDTYLIDEGAFAMQVIKQRWGPSGQVFMLELEPKSSRLSPREPIAEVF